jgi:hypothetical protein
VSHVSSVVWPSVLTSSLPQLSYAADVAPQDTRDFSATSPLPHTKPGAHALTRKTYIANHNIICLKPDQEDIADGSISNTLGPYLAHRASCPKFYHAQTNSNLS